MHKYQTIANALGVLQNLYQGPIVSQFNDETDAWRGAAQGKFPWQGKAVIRPLKVRRNQGQGATSDGGTLPPIGRQQTIEATIAARYHYLRLGLTGPSIKAAQSKMAAFVQMMSFEMEEAYNDAQKEINRAVFWSGRGDLALVNTAAVGSAVLVIKGRESTEPALKFVDVDGVYDIVTSGGTVEAQGVTVNSISSGDASTSTATLVLDQAVTVSADSILVRTNSFNLEIQGMLAQLDGATSTVYGIDRSSYVPTQGNVINLSGEQMTLDFWQRIQDEGERRGGKRKMKAVFVDYATRRMYYKLLSPDKRFQNTQQGDGGFSRKDETYLAFNEMPIVADSDCPTRILMVPPEFLEKYVMPGCEFTFADETGSVMIAEGENDRLEARMRFFANMFNSKAAGSAVGYNYVSP